MAFVAPTVEIISVMLFCKGLDNRESFEETKRERKNITNIRGRTKFFPTIKMQISLKRLYFDTRVLCMCERGS
jgi:hypothetical protein